MSTDHQNSVIQESHTVVIEPDRSWFRLPWRELFEYRDLIFLLVRRKFVATYKQPVLGPAWFVIQPLTQTLIFTVIFGHVAKIPTDGLPKSLFYLCGTLAWSHFARCMGGTSSTFFANASLFGKVYFPRLVMPISVVVSNLVGFAIQFVTFMGFWVYFKFFTPAGPAIRMSPLVVTLPLLLLLSGSMGLGVGLWISSLSSKYRDFMHLSGFLTSFWMYATPIVWPLSLVPHRWRWLAALNPMTGIVESYRYLFFGQATLGPMDMIMSVGVSALLLVSGILMFNRTERTFIDTV